MWNSLEITKLAVSSLTPLCIAVLGIYVSINDKKQSSNLQKFLHENSNRIETERRSQDFFISRHERLMERRWATWDYIFPMLVDNMNMLRKSTPTASDKILISDNLQKISARVEYNHLYLGDPLGECIDDVVNKMRSSIGDPIPEPTLANWGTDNPALEAKYSHLLIIAHRTVIAGNDSFMICKDSDLKCQVKSMDRSADMPST